ncbi:Chromo domain-containing protein [Aphelenchoides fujianensis]|nr:Chromo domain-containing protein [Aphelenchoides fujianensis]
MADRAIKKEPVDERRAKKSPSRSSSSSSSGTDSSEENIHHVESIISHRKVRGVYKYRIRWVGFDASGDTWEPESHLLGEYSRNILEEYKQEHGIEGKRKSTYEVKSEDESDDERNASWFVDPNAQQREVRNLFVDDRILSASEKLLSEQSDTGRLTRSQLRDLLPPKEEDEEDSEVESSPGPSSRRPTRRAKAAAKDAKGGAKRRSTGGTTAKKPKRVIESEDSEEEDESALSASFDEEASRRSRSKKAAPKPRESTPAEKKKTKRVSLSDDDFDGLESKPAAKAKAAKKKRPAEEPALNAAYAKQVRRTADEAVKPADFVKSKKKPASSGFQPPAAPPSKQFESYRIPKKGDAAPASSASASARPAAVESPPVPEENVGSDTSTSSDSVPTNDDVKGEAARPAVKVFPAAARKAPAPAAPPKSTVQWRPAVETEEREKECRLPGTNFQLTATLNIPPAQLSSYSRLNSDATGLLAGKSLSKKEFHDAVMSSKILIVRAALRQKSNDFGLNDVDSLGRTLLHRIAEQSCDQQHTADEIMDCLVNAGAQLDVRESAYQRTPLHVAVCARRTCHVRKLIELGSPVNTADGKGESTLITSLRQNALETSKLLLCSGATFQPAFTHPSLSRAQQKPALNFHECLQKALVKVRVRVLPGSERLVRLSDVFQAPLYEKEELQVELPFKPELQAGAYSLVIAMFALVNASDRAVIATSWGPSPLQKFFVNGEEARRLGETNRFLFGVLPAQLKPTNNDFRVLLDFPAARNSRHNLLLQFFGVPIEQPTSSAAPAAPSTAATPAPAASQQVDS